MRIIQSENPRPLNVLAVGPNGLVAAAGNEASPHGGVEIWNAASGEHEWSSEPHLWWFRTLAFLLHGTHFFAAHGSGEGLFTLCRGKKLQVEEIATTRWGGGTIAAANDRLFVGRSLGQGATGALTCWRVPEMKLLWIVNRWKPGTTFGGLAVDFACERIAFTVRVDLTHPIQYVEIRNTDEGQPLSLFPFDPATPVQQLAFTTDGAKLLVRTDNRSVQIFDAATGTPAGELVHSGRNYVTGIAVHPGGAVACARTNGTVAFWDVEKREQLRTLDWKAGKLVSIAFSPDGTLGAAGTEDGKVVVWDVDL